MSSLELKNIPKKLAPAFSFLRKIAVLLFILVFAGIYGFLVFRVKSLTELEPGPEALTEQLNTIQRPKIDQEAADKIKQLEDQNIQVQSLFDDARNNPFSE